MRTKIETITPDIARKMLSRAAHNRDLSRRLIDRYKGEIVAGNWAVNGESIKFSSSGELLDGQHRLNAVIAAGKSIQSLVVYGLGSNGLNPMDSIDTGKSRSVACVLQLENKMEYASCRIGSVHHILRMLVSPKIRSVSAKQMRECLQLLDKDILRSIHYRTKDKTDLITLPVFKTAQVVAPLVIGFKAGLEDECYEMVNGLATGEGLSAGGPIVAVRDNVLMARGTGTVEKRVEMSRKILASIWALHKDERSVWNAKQQIIDEYCSRVVALLGKLPEHLIKICGAGSD